MYVVRSTDHGKTFSSPLKISQTVHDIQFPDIAITGLVAPIPTSRIVMVDVRNLDPKERTLIEATDVTIAAIEPGRPGVPLADAINQFAADCDVIYLHVDEDVLDARFVPNHGTVEPNGPDIEAKLRAIRTVLATVMASVCFATEVTLSIVG